MKTAISVPDTTFVRADAYARRLGMTRSELYTRALEAFLGPPTDDEITRALDAVLASTDSQLDAEFRAAQQRAVGDEW